jgi:integrase
VIERTAVDFDLRRIGIHMPRSRYQRGTLSASVPAGKGRPERKLPRGTFWAQWYQYVREASGKEHRRRREKIIDRALAQKYQISVDYDGPLNKSDAQRVLDLLIAADSGTYVRPDTAATLEQVAREYLATTEPGWGPHTVRTSKGLIQHDLIEGKLGQRPVADLTEIELQRFLNGYVAAGASKSKLSKLLLYLRSILDFAVMKKIITANPAKSPGYKLKAKSKRPVSERYLSTEECRSLLSAVIGRDRLITRTLIQLGLRPEELFALRRDDVAGDALRIDEAIVEGLSSPVKSDASAAHVYIPPDLQIEFETWMECSEADLHSWLFPAVRGGVWGLKNYLNRVLKPAAIRAGVGVFVKKNKRGVEVKKTDVNFQVLRRTCGTLFGEKAKDPRDTQAQLRHADPTVTLRHYQKSVPANVKAAAIALEADLMGGENVLNRTGLEQVKN